MDHEPEAHPHAPDQTPLARLDRWLGGLAAVSARSGRSSSDVVHGLAGSAAVALLVLATIGNSRWAIAYLLVFGLGTVAGMMLITAVIAWPFSYAGGRFAGCQRGLRLASGVISLGFGLALAYRIGVVDGLFGANPTWMPH